MDNYIDLNNFEDIPVVPLRGLVVYPNMTLHFDVGREQSIKAIRQAMEGDRQIFLAAQKDFTVETPKEDDLYTVGVVARIVQLLNSGKDSVRVMVEGLYKAEAIHYTMDGEYVRKSVCREGQL